MEIAQAKTEELKIVDDIIHNLKLYALDDLGSELEIKEGVGYISHLSEKYRHIHVELKLLAGNQYEKLYPAYEKVTKSLDDYVLHSRKKLRDLNTRYLQDEKLNLENEKVDQMNALKVVFEVLKQKIAVTNDAVDLLTATKDQEIDRYISTMERFIDEVFDVSAKMKQVCPVSYNLNHAKNIQDEIMNIHMDVRLSKLLKHELYDARQKMSCNVLFSADRIKCVTKAENLSAELHIRFKTLSKKYGINLENLSDYQILDLHQKKSGDSEFNEILEKVTEMASLVSVGGEKVKRMLVQVSRTRDKLVSKRESFEDELSTIVVQRDITPEKMKQAAELSIELPKFTGYEGKMDFYTFRTEFKKLIEPRTQKKIWPDVLKRNYLMVCGRRGGRLSANF